MSTAGERSIDPPAGGDATAVRLVAWARVAVAVGVAAIGSFTTEADSRYAGLFLGVSLVAVPWATVLVLLSDRPKRWLLRYGGPYGDAFGVFAVQMAGSGSPGALVGHGLVVAFVAYTQGPRSATGVAAVTVALSSVAGTSGVPLAVLALPRSA